MSQIIKQNVRERLRSLAARLGVPANEQETVVESLVALGRRSPPAKVLDGIQIEAAIKNCEALLAHPKVTQEKKEETFAEICRLRKKLEALTHE